MDQDIRLASQEIRYPLALITGAAHRLGKSFAICLARLGFGIALHYHNSGENVPDVVDEIHTIGVPVFPIQADLRSHFAIQELFNSIDSLISDPNLSLDPLRVVVNSASMMMKSDVQTMSIEDFDGVMALNIRAPFLCAQLAFPRMSVGGLIVNISDIAAEKSWKDYGAYTISKAGLDSLTKILARAFAPKVRVNGIAPGLVLAGSGMTPEDWNRLVSRLPLKREASMTELCNALEFFIKNEYITGQIIKVDGGYSLL